MGFIDWMGLAGLLLLAMALAPPYLRRFSISTSSVYLLVGILAGPAATGLLILDVRAGQPWLEHLTEIAVIISLFIGGLKMRLPLRHPAWGAVFLLAVPGMLASIAGVALFAHFVFGLETGAALLLGAVLAPTDPVLASSVAVQSAGDQDRMRYGLSGEAGLNDGLAFPFVALALLWLQYEGAGDWLIGWGLHRLAWAIPVGLLVGYVMGRALGLLAAWLRSRHAEASGPNDFLALGLIVLAYVVTQRLGAWGFLAAFTAGIGLRHAELRIASSSRLVQDFHETADAPQNPDPYVPPPAEDLVTVPASETFARQPPVAAGLIVYESLSFGDTAERLLEFLLVVLVGVALWTHWDPRGVPLALALFLVIRPLSSRLLLAASRTSNAQRWLMGWFGIRGIGSLYYLSYAINNGLPARIADDIAQLTLTVVAISILLHGVTARPLLNWYEAKLNRDKTRRP